MTLGNFKYVYSFDDVDYKGNFNARSQAKREAIAQLKAGGESSGTFYVGKITTAPCPSISAEIVIEDLQATAKMAEFGGEFAEGWLEDVAPVDKAALTVMLSTTFEKWAQKYEYLPTWQGVRAKDKYRYINGKVVLLEREGKL